MSDIAKLLVRMDWEVPVTEDSRLIGGGREREAWPGIGGRLFSCASTSDCESSTTSFSVMVYLIQQCRNVESKSEDYNVIPTPLVVVPRVVGDSGVSFHSPSLL